MRTLHIVGCSARKAPALRNGPMPARAAYMGQSFRAARDWLEAHRCKYVILSAKYGILWPDALVSWYDERMPERTHPAEWEGSLDGMPQKQYGRLFCFDRYVCLAGESYAHAAEQILDRLVERPLAGQGIGQRLHSLKFGKW